MFVVKIDHTINAANTVWYRFQSDTGLQAAYTDPINSIFNSYSPQPQYTLVAGYTHIFRPNLVNQFNPGTSWYSSIFEPNNYAQVQQTFPVVLAAGSNNAPFTTIGGNNNIYPQGRKVTQWQINDNLDWIRGKQEYRFGINTRRIDVSDYDLGEGSVPTVVYNDLAEFTYGAAYTESWTFPVSFNERIAAGNLDLYAMDTYKPTPKATFIVGVRATWNTDPVNQQHLFARPAGSFLDMSHNANQPLNQVIQTGVRSLFPSTPVLVWQPRVSLAYQVAPGIVIHLGFGVFNDIIPAQIADLAATNAPYAPTLAIRNSNPPAATNCQYVFTMTQSSDFNANLMFDLGTSTAGVSLSNISLSISPPTTATLLQWVQPPASAVAGNPISPEIQVGAYNETFPVAGLPVTLFITNGIGVLAGIQSTNTDTNGIAHFPNLSFSQAGLKQLAAANSSLVITSAVFTITAPPVAATGLSWAQQPSSAMAGAVITPEIQVAARTNATPVPNLLLTLSLTNSAGTLAGIQATNTDANGIAHFPNLSINRAGLKQLAVGDPTTTLVANSATFSINAAAPNKLVIVQPPPANATAGMALTPPPVVQVTDLYGNVISNAADAISAVQTRGTGGNLNATTAAQTVIAGSGTAVFSGLYVTNASGNVSLSFNDATLPNPNVISSIINVSANAATLLWVSQQPSSTATAGAIFAQQPVVTIADAYGNTVASYTSAVMAAEVGGGSLNASPVLPSAMPLNGIASFTGLFVTNASPAVTLDFSSGSLPPVESAAINVNAGPASQLLWSTQPGNAISGRPFDTQPILQTADIFANPSTSGLAATQNVQVLLNTGIGPLLGTTNYNLGSAGSNGVVTFNNLRLDVPWAGDVLTATNITPNPPIPPGQNQLGLWLDASVLNSLTLSGNSVTTWSDQSGHGRNAGGSISPVLATNTTLAAGAWGQGRVVRFNGSSAYLIVDLTFLNQTPYTIAVIEVASNKGSQTSYFMGDTGSGGNATDNSLHTGYRSSGDFTFAHYGDDLDFVPGSFVYPAARVWMDTINAQTNKTIYLNGVAVVTGTAAGFLNSAGSQGHIGSGFDTSSTCFQGDIAEILVYTNDQSANAAGIASYLSNKWLSAGSVQPALASAVTAPFTVHAAPPPPQIILGATVAVGGSVVLTYATTAGFQYLVQYSTNLALGSWTTLPASATNATGAVVVFSDTNTPGNTQRFYRIVSP